MNNVIKPSKIIVLSPHVANSIAAGEVVERPSSIVKELVENSIDAGASSISVEIKEGGIESILICDNGCGIPPEDCLNAFMRHATSKIHSVEDLGNIGTLGFRGEALASIAAVARTSLTTRTADNECGRRVVIEQGKIEENVDYACPLGTQVLVTDLFANIPARLKFLKSPRAESGSIGDYLSRCILANPGIAIRYVSNDKKIYESFEGQSLKDTIVQVYGQAVESQLLKVEFDNGYIRIDGFIGSSELSSPNRSRQSFFVNGRYIKSNALSFNVLRAYDTRLMSNRYPFAVLNLTIALGEADVNVHPSKTEIRFVNEGKAMNAVYMACREALSREVITYPKVNVASEAMPSSCEVVMKSSTAAPSYGSIEDIPFEEKPIVRSSGDMSGGSKGAADIPNRKPETSFYHSNGASFSMREPSRSAGNTWESKPLWDIAKRPTSVAELRDVNVVGQVFGTFWIAEKGDDMYLIDQHAAHERRLYEQLINQKISMTSQRLLIPMTVKLLPEEYEAVYSYTNELKLLGFVWSQGDEPLTLKLSSLPVLGGKLVNTAYFPEALEILNNGSKRVGEDLIKERLTQSACKHAVKAGDALSREEICSLLSYFITDGIPLTCPHGRPVITKISRHEIDKMFKRIV